MKFGHDPSAYHSKADQKIPASKSDLWILDVCALTLTLQDPYRGEPVAAVFENLLPDSESLCRRVAEKVGARGTDAYSLLAAIGRDCVGALQFVADGAGERIDSTAIEGEVVDEAAIDKVLRNLAEAPLGLDRDENFHISVAGAQEKTALLRYEDQWFKPRGTTPITHLFKPQIGQLPNGLELSNSVENEYYCLKLFEASSRALMPVRSSANR